MPKTQPVEIEKWHHAKDWHAAHQDRMTFGERIADAVAAGMGSWRFIIIQSVIVATWIALNMVEVIFKPFDPYPFILLNLLFSTQAAYAAPVIMMSQNRSAERDRFQATADFQTNLDSKKDIESVQSQLARIENEKLDKILTLLTDGDSGKLDAILAILKSS